MAQQDTSVVTFFLNGKQVEIDSPPADLRLVDYLHLPEVQLTGSKKGCGQGGCGACTVVLSAWDTAKGTAQHRSINSCLRPVAALNGLAVTTIEGTGSVTSEMNPVAFSLAKNNGSQCGYCSPGWVMNMTAYMSANGAKKPTKQEIENIFDGNLCRCTGYRPILEAMKTYASNWSPDDQKNLMKCLIDPAFKPAGVDSEIELALPPSPWGPEAPLAFESDGYVWRSPSTVEELLSDISELGGTSNLRLVCGNTSVGVYDYEVENPQNLIDINAITSLKQITVNASSITVGSAVTYTDLIAFLETQIATLGATEARNFEVIHYMASRTAGTIVRNAASIAGNNMLVFKHIHQGEPFPSDAITAYIAAGVTIEVTSPAWGTAPRTMAIEEFIEQTITDENYPYDKVILSYDMPFSKPNEYIQCQKVARREVNSHSIVNSGIQFDMDTDLKVLDCRVVFGGVATYPFRATNTEAAFKEYGISLENLPKIITAVQEDVKAAYTAPDKNTGITYDYKLQLAESFVYKTMVNVIDQLEPCQVPDQDKSAGVIKWGTWGVTGGTQTFETEKYRFPISEPFIKTEAFLQASGETTYVHDYVMPPNALYGAAVTSERALANFCFIAGSGPQTPITAADLSTLLAARFPDTFKGFITVADVPNRENLGPDDNDPNLVGMGADQPVYADGYITYFGQAIGVILAVNDVEAVKIAYYVTSECVQYSPLSATNPLHNVPAVLTIDEAAADGQIFPDYPESASFVSHIWKIKRAGSDMAWLETTPEPAPGTIDVQPTKVENNSCNLVRAQQKTGDQMHFYMETQSTAAFPNKDGSMRLHPSSQSPMDVHSTVASVLGLPLNKVAVEIPYVGGGYGGKTTQSVLVAAMAVVAANKTRVPVRLALQRAEDSAMVGHRHAYQCDYQIAIDTGADNAANKGLIRGWQGNFLGDGGATYDCSLVVGDCLQLRLDSAYFVRNYQTKLDVVRTNKASNTAFRSMGDIQGIICYENAIDNAATSVGMPTDEVRQKNLYDIGQSTPFGQTLTYCYMRDVWNYAITESDYTARKADIETFNSENKWLKRAISIVPVKYASGYNLVTLEQTSALVSVYSGDGTLCIRQGGVDMGQGILTQIMQIAAYELNVPLTMVNVESADTSVVPNPSSTGASTGTQYNGFAVREACRALRTRLQDYAREKLVDNGDTWCKDAGIDYWNYGTDEKTGRLEGWRHEAGNGKLIWQNIVGMAFGDRVNLQAQYHAEIPGGTTPSSNLTFKTAAENKAIPGIPVQTNNVTPEASDNFLGFTYNVAVSEVEVDILTVETTVVRTDIYYDMGKSMNPAIDIGQIEGAFVQGIGYVLTEESLYENDTSKDSYGQLNTPNTWGYKIPATTSIPKQMNVTLFPREKAAAGVPEAPSLLYSSKEVGEPPLVLAASVFMAVKNAVRASRVERGLSPLFELSCPATVQEVTNAADIQLS
ncbi:MAG: molybdopterin-dependent oxidoreductase [Kordiimonadaceae bacterium]|nr:molybdopterin-dependent oxidoreductase [Kordiimonadaceae bacterium]